MTILGLILARGGSKRVPRKNLRLLGGKPLIAWTIMAGRYAEPIDRLGVSSEDDEILAVAKRYGAEPFEWLCLLQPTSPFRTAGDIDRCLAGREVCGRQAIVSVERGKSVPNGAIYLGRTDWLRAELANGVALPFDGRQPARFPMPAHRCLDIDTEEDFVRAEATVKEMAA